MRRIVFLSPEQMLMEIDWKSYSMFDII